MFGKRLPLTTTSMLFLNLAAGISSAATLTLAPEDIGWDVFNETAQFHFRFFNRDASTSTRPASGSFHARPFGAFSPATLLVGTFEIPALPPGGFHDVSNFAVDVCNLPDGCESKGVPAGAQAGPAGPAPAVHPCGFDWNGGVEIAWSGPDGPGRVQRSLARFKVCAGGDTSSVFIPRLCSGPTEWTLENPSAGITAVLLSGDGSPAPNPVPPSLYTYLAGAAGEPVPVGTIATVVLTFACADTMERMDVRLDVCSRCMTPVAPRTWGMIKLRAP